jgi:hypothetical protein
MQELNSMELQIENDIQDYFSKITEQDKKRVIYFYLKLNEMFIEKMKID